MRTEAMEHLKLLSGWLRLYAASGLADSVGLAQSVAGLMGWVREFDAGRTTAKAWGEVIDTASDAIYQARRNWPAERRMVAEMEAEQQSMTALVEQYAQRFGGSAAAYLPALLCAALSEAAPTAAGALEEVG